MTIVVKIDFLYKNKLSSVIRFYTNQINDYLYIKVKDFINTLITRFLLLISPDTKQHLSCYRFGI